MEAEKTGQVCQGLEGRLRVIADAFLSRRHWVLRDLLNHLLFSLTFPRHAVLPKLVPATHERGWGGKKRKRTKGTGRTRFCS